MQEKQINIIDTPGHIDFIAEVERALSILDAAILVISAVEGIQSQTEILYEALKTTHTNVIIFINKIDRIGSNVADVLRQIKEKFTGQQASIETGLGPDLEALTLSIADLDEEIMEAYLYRESIQSEILLDNLKCT